jgi:AraC family transcriptional regulator of arabinose operon
MDRTGPMMDKTRTTKEHRLPASLRQTEDIYFHTPGRRSLGYPYIVLAAGRTTAARDEAPVRRRFNQHVLILTLDGSGQIEAAGRSFAARPGTLVWLDTARQYAHGCHPATAHWHYLWIGVRGFGLDLVFASTRALVNPITELVEMSATTALFEAVIARMQSRAADADAANNAAVATMIAHAVAARDTDTGMTSPGDSIEVLQATLHADLARSWSVDDMARKAGLGPSQLHRRFHQATGTSPMDWLRHERINAAKRYLVASDERINTVAVRCGFADPYHFSRVFRRIAGVSPSAFRRTGGT